MGSTVSGAECHVSGVTEAEWMSELERRVEQMKAQYGSLATLEEQMRSQGVSPDDHRLYTDLLEWYAIDHELAELMHAHESSSS
jgi:hypothetical protein